MLEMGSTDLIGRYFKGAITTLDLALAPTMPVFYVCRYKGPLGHTRDVFAYKGSADSVSDQTAQSIFRRLGAPHGEFMAMADAMHSAYEGLAIEDMYGIQFVSTDPRYRARLTVSDADGNTVGDSGDGFSNFPLIEPNSCLVVSYAIRNRAHGAVARAFVTLDVLSLDHRPSSDAAGEYDKLAVRWQAELIGPSRYDPGASPVWKAA